jgi:hypothetical protein
MSQDDVIERAKRIGWMFAALGQRSSEEEIAAYVQSTSRIPLYWLGEAVKRVVRRWDQMTKPKPVHISREAFHAAGFVPYTTPAEVVSPSPDRVKWWPKPGQRAPEMLANRWYEPLGRILAETATPAEQPGPEGDE